VVAAGARVVLLLFYIKLPNPLFWARTKFRVTVHALGNHIIEFQNRG
jgi:hypothetical protein